MMPCKNLTECGNGMITALVNNLLLLACPYKANWNINYRTNRNLKVKNYFGLIDLLRVSFFNV
jgi:hypothetical protein